MNTEKDIPGSFNGLEDLMRAVQITKPGEFHFTEVPIPKVGDQDVLIRVAAAGICGTDIHIFKGEYEAVYPIIPGHEFSGTVAEVGKDVKYFMPGDRVTADPNIPCHRCGKCKRGYFNQCENLEAAGVTRNGAFAEYVSVPEGVVFPIQDIPFREAAMIEPIACVIWGLKRVDPQPGDSALIFGAGPMGCLVTQALKTSGVSPIIVVDKIEWRLDIASKLGATNIFKMSQIDQLVSELNQLDFEIVADATGVGQVLENAFQYVKPRGKLWVFGVVAPAETVRFSPYEIFRKDLSIIGSFAVNQTFTEAISFLKSGAVKVNPLISHQIPLERFDEAIHLAQYDPRRMKVQLICS
jgi:D-arabinitol dehydrogenase (NADP+)